MGIKIAVLALSLAACQTVPSDIMAIKQGVDSRITYKHYYKNDYRYLPQGGEGNCAVFAYNYATDAMRKGYKARVVIEYVGRGEPHAVAIIDDIWKLDNTISWIDRY